MAAAEEQLATAEMEYIPLDAGYNRFTPPGPRLPRPPTHHLNIFSSRLERLASTRAPPPMPPPDNGGFDVARRHVAGAGATATATGTAADTSCLGKSKYEEPRGGGGGDDTARSGADSTGCLICIAEFEVGDDLSTIPCAHRHRFHDKCLAEWLKRSRSCPLCRHLLPAVVPANNNNIHFL
uniref:RING-type domain-containing protein n=1 Tax=Oryza punctata TaxID=4537 RepID=A0A0E0MCH0_ORYPU